MKSRVVSIRLFAALALILLLQAGALSKGISFEKYQGLSEEDRQKLIKRYVKKGDDYWNVCVGNYLVHSDISAERALAIAVKMDEFHRRFTKLFKGSFKIKERPQLYVTKTKEGYHAAVSKWFKGRMGAPGWSAGLFAVSGRRFALFSYSRDDEDQFCETLFHEGTHQLMRFYLGRSCPVWFNEGMATNLETWDVSLSTDRNIAEEIWKSRRPMLLYAMATGKNNAGGQTLSVKASGKPNLGKLMDITHEQWSAAKNPSANYAQAWGIVNFLITHGPTSQKYMSKLLLAFRGLRPIGKVIISSRDRDALIEHWNRYITEVIVPHYDYSVGIEKLVKSARYADAEKLVKTGMEKYPENFELLYYKGLIALRSEKAKEAYKILTPLKKKYPHHPLLDLTLGEAALAAGDRTRAKRHLKAALAEDSRDEKAKKLLEKANKPPSAGK